MSAITDTSSTLAESRGDDISHSEPAPRRARLFRKRQLELRYVILIFVGLIIAYLAVVPLITMMIASLRSTFLSKGPSSWTFENYVTVFRSDGLARLLLNSFSFAVISAGIATSLGFGLAFLVSRTNTPAKFLAYVVALVPLVVPSLLMTISWAQLFTPLVGPLNIFFQTLHLPQFDIYSWAGMVFIEAMIIMPLAFLMGVSAFSAMDSSLEEAALANGASPRQMFRSITLPLIKPAITSAGLLMFVLAISTFEVPQLIGFPIHKFTVVSEVYTALEQYPPNYGTVGVIGVAVLAIAALGMWFSQRVVRNSRAQTISGKGFRATPINLGRWRWFGFALVVLAFVVVAVLPLLMLIWSSFLPFYKNISVDAVTHLTFKNYRTIWSTPSLLSSIRNSVITAVIAGAIVTVLSAVGAYISIKTRLRGRNLLDFLAVVPVAIPGVILGVGMLYWYLVAPIPVHLYGTLAILVIAFVTTGIPYGFRYMSAGISQINDELEEAAIVSGSTWLQTFRKIYFPLLAPSLAASFLWVVLLAFRDISTVILLYSTNTNLITITVFNLWTGGSPFTVVAAMGVLLMLTLAFLVFLGWLLLRVYRGKTAGILRLPGR